MYVSLVFHEKNLIVQLVDVLAINNVLALAIKWGHEHKFVCVSN